MPVSRIQSDENRYRGGRSIDDDAWQLERAQRYRMALFDMHKPSICQVHGFCLAGGTDIALLCDMVIAADDATFGFPPARNLGALPNNMWLYNVGPQWAKRLTMTGDTVTGKEAQQIGLVMKSVPREHLEAEVEQLADRLAMIDPGSAHREQTHHQSRARTAGRAHAAAAGRGERRARPQHARRRRISARVRRGGLAAALKDARSEVRRRPCARERTGDSRRGRTARRRLTTAEVGMATRIVSQSEWLAARERRCSRKRKR